MDFFLSGPHWVGALAGSGLIHLSPIGCYIYLTLWNNYFEAAIQSRALPGWLGMWTYVPIDGKESTGQNISSYNIYHSYVLQKAGMAKPDMYMYMPKQDNQTEW